MKRIAFVGTVGAGKTTLFNALQGNYTLARKTQAVEFNDNGDIDTPGEYFSHPRWYHLNYHATGCGYADLCPRRE